MQPGFLIVGAQRCGTTSMTRALSEHPAVFSAALRLEVHYFDSGYDRGLAWYRSHFPLRARAWLTARAAGAQISGSLPALVVDCLGARSQLVGDGPGVAGHGWAGGVDLVQEQRQGAGDAGCAGLVEL